MLCSTLLSLLLICTCEGIPTARVRHRGIYVHESAFLYSYVGQSFANAMAANDDSHKPSDWLEQLVNELNIIAPPSIDTLPSIANIIYHTLFFHGERTFNWKGIYQGYYINIRANLQRPQGRQALVYISR